MIVQQTVTHFSLGGTIFDGDQICHDVQGVEIWELNSNYKYILLVLTKKLCWLQVLRLFRKVKLCILSDAAKGKVHWQVSQM